MVGLPQQQQPNNPPRDDGLQLAPAARLVAALGAGVLRPTCLRPPRPHPPNTHAHPPTHTDVPPPAQAGRQQKQTGGVPIGGEIGVVVVRVVVCVRACALVRVRVWLWAWGEGAKLCSRSWTDCTQGGPPPACTGCAAQEVSAPSWSAVLQHGVCAGAMRTETAILHPNMGLHIQMPRGSRGCSTDRGHGARSTDRGHGRASPRTVISRPSPRPPRPALVPPHVPFVVRTYRTYLHTGAPSGLVAAGHLHKDDVRTVLCHASAGWPADTSGTAPWGGWGRRRAAGGGKVRGVKGVAAGSQQHRSAAHAYAHPPSSARPPPPCPIKRGTHRHHSII